MLGSQRSHCHDRTNLGVVDSTEPRASGGKDKCQVPLVMRHCMRGVQHDFKGLVTMGFLEENPF